jgi:hypothetical protein
MKNMRIVALIAASAAALAIAACTPAAEETPAAEAEVAAEEATEEANRRANASWALMCEKMVAAEREACAKVCDEDLKKWNGQADVQEVASAIRARGAA